MDGNTDGTGGTAPNLHLVITVVWFNCAMRKSGHSTNYCRRNDMLIAAGVILVCSAGNT